MFLAVTVCQAGTITFDPFPSIPPDVTVEYFNGGLTGPLASLPTPIQQALVSSSSAVPGGGNALATWYPSGGLPSPLGVLLTFNTPWVTFFSLIGNDFGGDPDLDNEVAYLTGFDALGNVVGTASFSSPWAQPNLKYPELTVLTGMKYVAFTWTNDLGYYAIDNVQYTPEPGTWVLMGLGLTAVAFIRRRR